MTLLSNSWPGDMINQPNFVSSAMGALSSWMHGFVSVFILAYSPLPRITCTGSLAFVSLWLTCVDTCQEVRDNWGYQLTTVLTCLSWLL